MPTIKLGNFSKRVNSTKTPTATDLAAFTEYTVTYKKPTSLRSPVVEIATDVRTYDYAYISDFNRYYFVSDVISIHNGLTEYHLEADPMSSQKSKIGNTVARIAFGSTGYDSEYNDNRMAVYSTKEFYQSGVTNVDYLDDNFTGYYVLVTLNEDGGKGAFGTAYALNPAAMEAFASQFCQYDFNQLSPAISEFFGGNMMNSIISCCWVPFNFSALPSGAVSTGGVVKVGTYSFSGLGNVYKLPSDSSKEKVYNVTFPSQRYTDYRRIEPYSTGQIFLPGIGCADICMADWVTSASIDVDTVIDFLTGDISYYLRNPNNHTIIQTFNACVAADIPIGHISRNMTNAVAGFAGAGASIVSAVVGLATENYLLAAGSAAAAIGSAASGVLSYNKRAASVSGGISGKTSAYFTGIFINYFKCLTEDPEDSNFIAIKGRPVNKTHAISNHAGFVICDDASVVGAMESWEREIINGYLNSGFFYE